MANSKEKVLTEKKTLLNKQKIRIRKQIVKLERLLVNTDPESPLFNKYSEQKEELVIKLYSRETEYELAINKLQTEVDKLKKNHKDLNDIKKLIQERKRTGFFDPGDSRLKKDLKRVWTGAKEAVNIKKKMRTLREKIYDDVYEKVEDFMDGWEKFKDSYKYRFFHAGVKGIVKLGLAPLKFAVKTALTKKVDQKKFLGISYGGRRVGRFKFNDNFMRKFSSDYQRLSDDFYLMGGKLRNRDIKKGNLDAGDIILYLQQQGKTSEEIVDQLKEFQKYGIEISNSYRQLLNPTQMDDTVNDEDDFETIFSDGNFINKETGATVNPDDINFQNQAVFIDEQNKEALRDSLLEFYDYIQKDRESKKKKSINLMETVTDLVSKTASGITDAFKYLGLLLFSGMGLFGMVATTLLALVGYCIYKLLPDEARQWIDEHVKSAFNWIIDAISGISDWFKEDITAPTDDSTLEEKQAYIMKRLMDEGYEKEFASGVLANLQNENAAFDPTVIGDNGTSAGLAQWHNERWDRLKEYSKANGKNWQTIEAQTDFLIHELKTDYAMDTDRANRMSAVDASRWVTKHYEIPRDTEYQAYKRSQDVGRYLSMDVEGILKRAADRTPDAQTTAYAQRNIGNQKKLIDINGKIDDFDAELNEITSENPSIITGSKDIASNSASVKIEDDNKAVENITPVNIGTSTPITLGVNPNPQINDQIILKEEQAAKEQELKSAEKKREALRAESGPGPIEVPSFLGGGDLLVLNTVMR